MADDEYAYVPAVAPVDDGVWKPGQRMGPPTLCARRAQPWVQLEQLGHPFELGEESAGYTHSGFGLVEADRVRQVLCREPMNRSRHRSSVRSWAST